MKLTPMSMRVNINVAMKYTAFEFRKGNWNEIQRNSTSLSVAQSVKCSNNEKVWSEY